MNQLFKSCVLALCVVVASVPLHSQTSNKPRPAEVPKGWHLLDKSKDGFYGISLNEAYQFVQSKNLKSNQVVVAVIDSGIDTLHEDLKSILWTNPKELPGNGK